MVLHCEHPHREVTKIEAVEVDGWVIRTGDSVKYVVDDKENVVPVLELETHTVTERIGNPCYGGGDATRSADMMLLEMPGPFPRLHGVRELVGILKEVIPARKEI